MIISWSLFFTYKLKLDISITREDIKNNNKMERYNGEFRDREKIVRGIKIKDSVLINGYQMYHNYLRPHMGLNDQTPAQACGINIEGDNKWKTLIQRASL